MEMKSVLKATALSVLMMSAMAAQAVPVSTNLIVRGTITPAACVPSLADGGIINFGDTSAGRLPVDGSMTLESKSLTATIACASAASVVMTFQDNRADTVSLTGGEATTAETAFGLGKAGDINIGSYGIQITSVSSDDAQGVMLQSTDRQMWSNLGATDFVNNSADSQYLTFGDSSSNVPTEVKTLTFSLQVTPSLNAALKNISDTANLDGNATISFEYL